MNIHISAELLVCVRCDAALPRGNRYAEERFRKRHAHLDLICQVHDANDPIPGRICGRYIPCKDHAPAARLVERIVRPISLVTTHQGITYPASRPGPKPSAWLILA